MDEVILVDRTDVNQSDNSVTIVLRGGPRSISETLLNERVTIVVDQGVKIPHLGGYEHFRRDDECTAPSHSVVYQWTMRTKVAE